MNVSKIVFFFFCCIAITQRSVAQDAKELTSPDGKLVFSFSLSAEKAPLYSLRSQNKPIVLASAMGVNGWDKNFTLYDVSVSKKDTIWKPVYGERSQVRDHYQEMLITLLQNNNERSKLQIQVRAYNEGIAFRYFFPEHPQGGRDISIQKELTEFTMPEGTQAWFTDRAQGSYSLLPMTKWPGESERPLVLEIPGGGYACIAEAEM